MLQILIQSSDSDLLKPFLVTLLILVCSFSGSVSLAVQVEGLYSASVPVNTQYSEDRDLAFDAALENVLIKVTGQPEISRNTSLIQAILPAQPYVLTYGYRDNPDFKTYVDMEEQVAAQAKQALESAADPSEQGLLQALKEEVADSLNLPEQKPAPFLLEVSFSKALIDNKLTQWQVPIWGNVRPNVLVWAVEAGSGGREVVSSVHPYAEEIVQEAARYGVPVYFPVMDLQDVAAVDVNDLWGLFPEAVAEANERYKPDSTVLVRINRLGKGRWSARWTLMQGSSYNSSEFEAENVTTLWRALMSTVSAELAKRYAVQGTSDDTDGLLIEVSDVDSFGDYAELRAYLLGLSPVADARLVRLDRNALRYRIQLRGTAEQFREYIALGGLLQVQLPPTDALKFGPAADSGSSVLSADTLYTEPAVVKEPVQFLRWLGRR